MRLQPMHRYLLVGLLGMMPFALMASRSVRHVIKKISIGGDYGLDYLTADTPQSRLPMLSGSFSVLVVGKSTAIEGHVSAQGASLFCARATKCVDARRSRASGSYRKRIGVCRPKSAAQVLDTGLGATPPRLTNSDHNVYALNNASGVVRPRAESGNRVWRRYGA
jgi:hypothetical protein